MAETGLDTLIPKLRALVSAAHYKELSDGHLLEQFVSNRDELAFKTLVRRHGPLILGVCCRVLGSGPDMDDVFQATFMVLARKAGSIRQQQSVSGWLYGVAFRLARKQKKRLGRQHVHEHSGENLEEFTETRAMGIDPVQQASLHEIGAILDEELQKLPTKNRETFVLCQVEGLSAAEAAKRLGCPLPTLKSRLNKARELLRQRLVRRGVALSITGVAVAFAGQSARAAVPHKLACSALQAALAFAAKPVACGAVSAQAAALAKGLLKTMSITKLSLTFLAVLTVTVLGFGAAMGPYQKADKELPSEIASQPIAAAVQQPPPARVQEREETLCVKVLDPEGKPVPDAKIHASIWTNEKDFKAPRDYQTDAQGIAQVKLPKTLYILRLWASKTMFVSLFSGWEQSELAGGPAIPADYTFRLEAAVAAGGRVVDEQGKPISGAKVKVRLAKNFNPANGDGRTSYNTWLAFGEDEPTTDADGRWRIDNVPDHVQTELSLILAHPDYASDDEWGETQKAAAVTTAMLRAQTATLTLKRGIIVNGQVTDSAGKPIKDAVVVLGGFPETLFTQVSTKFPADAEGHFKLPPMAPRETTLTVIAPGWAPQFRKLSVKPELTRQDFHMVPGQPIRLRIVDDAGKPIPNAFVRILEWKKSQAIQALNNPNDPKVPDSMVRNQADADGIWEWASGPDSPVKLSVSSKGFTSTELEIAGGAALRTVTLKREFLVTGRVTDAVTGKAIPTFTVVPLICLGKNQLHADPFNVDVGKSGDLKFVPQRNDVPLRVRIKALGYRTQDGPEFRVGDKSSFTQNFELKPSPSLVGVVLGTDGKPLSKAEVMLATPTEQVSVTETYGSPKTLTDAAGRFVFPDPGEACAVVVQTAGGFARAEFPAEQHDLGTLQLQPWASVSGQFRDDGKPVSGALILLQPIRLDSLDRPNIDGTMQAVTGADGRFEFPRVPPGPTSVRAHLGPWKEQAYRSGPGVPLHVKPGQRSEVELGGTGTIIKGKVKLTGKVPTNLDCTYSINYLVHREPVIVPPPTIASLGFDVRSGWRQGWLQSSEGLAYLRTLRHWFVKLAPDGAFQISGVPPGEYDLAIEIYAKTENCLVDPLARKVVRVTVTAADAARGNLALPEITAEVAPVPVVGDTPSLTFQLSDNTAGTLANSRGRYTVVHFWASWCGACKHQLPALRKLQERFAARGLATLGLSLDDDPAAWQAALKRVDLPWQQGRLATASASGISSVPTYWLLDPKGAIVAKVYDPDELDTILAKALK